MVQHRVRGVSEFLMHRSLMVVLSCVVQCSVLVNPVNGSIFCSRQLPVYEDVCNFTCNTGYELIGGNIRTCQKDGNWSGSSPTCNRGQIIAT